MQNPLIVFVFYSGMFAGLQTGDVALFKMTLLTTLMVRFPTVVLGYSLAFRLVTLALFKTTLLSTL